jgi:hypothetical protein
LANAPISVTGAGRASLARLRWASFGFTITMAPLRLGRARRLAPSPAPPLPREKKTQVIRPRAVP